MYCRRLPANSALAGRVSSSGIGICLCTLSLTLFSSLAPSALRPMSLRKKKQRAMTMAIQEEPKKSRKLKSNSSPTWQVPQVEAVLVAETQEPQLELEFVTERLPWTRATIRANLSNAQLRKRSRNARTN